MNECKKVGRIEFFLQDMCAMKVAEQILVASDVKLVDLKGRLSVEKEAMRRLGLLKLPRTWSVMVRHFISPLLSVLSVWHRKFPSYGLPSLTPHGSVDTIQSVKAILANEAIDKMERYKLACEHCCEEVIYELFEELNFKDENGPARLRMMEMDSPFVYFWTNSLLGQFESPMRGQFLRLDECNEGFELALNLHNDAAVWHFIDRVTPEVVRSCINENFRDSASSISFLRFSPATLNLLASRYSVHS